MSCAECKVCTCTPSKKLSDWWARQIKPISVVSSYGRFEINKLITINSDTTQLIYENPETRLLVTILTVNPAEVYPVDTASTPTLYINKAG